MNAMADCLIDNSTELSKRDKRRHAIMDAAFELFVDQGFRQVSMTEIIRKSGGSLSTAYSLFENKEGLLRAIVAERFNQYSREVDKTIMAKGLPADVLTQAARLLYSRLFDSDFVGLLRITVAESMHNPEFGMYVKTCTADIATCALAQAFSRWDEQALLYVDDSFLAAETYLALLLHRGHMHALCGLPLETDPLQTERHINHVVKTILERYRIKDKPAIAALAYANMH